MSSNNSGINSSLVSEVQSYLKRSKIEAASGIGLEDYENQYKASLSSRINGNIGGFMVKHMIESYEQGLK